MGHYLYILFSPSLNRYYIGESEDPTKRSEQHNTHFFKGSATKIASDWTLQISIGCDDRAHARRIEKWLKSQKSTATVSRMINELKYRTYQLERFRTVT